MDTINFFVLLTSIINISLSVFIFIKATETKSISMRYFSYFGFAISAWCLSMFVYRDIDSVEGSIFMAKVLYIAASFTPSTFLIFNLSFLDKKVRKIWLVAIVIINILVILPILFSNQFISNVIIPAYGEKEIIFENLYYWIYAIYIPLGFTLSFVILIYKYFSKEFRENKSQILLIILGSLITSNLAMITNLTMPSLGDFSLNWFGQVSTFVWLIAISYSILRFRLFDIKLLIGRVVYYAIIGLFAYSTFYLVAFLYIRLFGDIYAPGAYILGIINAIAFVSLYDKFKDFFSHQINTKFINPGFDPKEVVNKYNSKINTVLDQDELIDISLKTISSSIRADFEAILLCYESKNCSVFSKKESIEFDKSKFEELFTIWEHAGDTPINSEIIDIQMSREFRNMRNWMDPVVEEMKKSNIKLIVPLEISSEDRHIGMIILGPKEGNAGYDSIETKFVKDIASSLSSALGRSELHNEVQDLNENLQKKVEEATTELKQKVIALEDARRRERDMLDILGHELRTPLTIVRNAVQMMKVAKGAGTLDEEMLNKYLDMAEENTKREVSLLETMLTTTKIDNDSLSLVLTKVHLNDVVDDTFTALTDKAERKGLKLKRIPTDEQIYVYADRDRFQEVVDNITDNAVKYTEKGEVNVSLSIKDGFGFIVVKDTGIGIPKEKIGMLGQKFYRVGNYLESSGSSGMQIVRPGGTGLGLYVVFELAKAMGGDISVTSEVGKGSTFTIKIPLFDGQEDSQIGAKKESTFDKFKRMKEEKEKKGKEK